MGLGSSREYYEPQPIRPPSPPRPPFPGTGRAVRRHRRRIFRGGKPGPTTLLPLAPARHHSPHRHPHRPRHYPLPMHGYGPMQQVSAPSIPMSYNNYTGSPYMSPQSMMMPPQQQVQPMFMPQQLPQSYPMMLQQPRPLTMSRFQHMMFSQQQPFMMPQYMPQPQPMMMPQEMPQAQAMRMPQQMPASMYSPYASSPYAMSAPYSTPYVQQQQPLPPAPPQQHHHHHHQQQQPQVQPMYNHLGASVPAPVGIPGPPGPFSVPNRPAGLNLGTDWTGGGKISPGFLGPPL